MATTHFISLGRDFDRTKDCVNEEMVEYLNDRIKKGLLNTSSWKRGDVIRVKEFSKKKGRDGHGDRHEDYYRTDGLFYWNGEAILLPSFDCDEYGCPPSELSYPEFPPIYWKETQMDSFIPVKLPLMNSLLIYTQCVGATEFMPESEWPVIEHDGMYFIYPIDRYRDEEGEYDNDKIEELWKEVKYCRYIDQNEILINAVNGEDQYEYEWEDFGFDKPIMLAVIPDQ